MKTVVTFQHYPNILHSRKRKYPIKIATRDRESDLFSKTNNIFNLFITAWTRDRIKYLFQKFSSTLKSRQPQLLIAFSLTLNANPSDAPGQSFGRAIIIVCLPFAHE